MVLRLYSVWCLVSGSTAWFRGLAWATDSSSPSDSCSQNDSSVPRDISSTTVRLAPLAVCGETRATVTLHHTEIEAEGLSQWEAPASLGLGHYARLRRPLVGRQQRRAKSGGGERHHLVPPDRLRIRELLKAGWEISFSIRVLPFNLPLPFTALADFKSNAFLPTPVARPFSPVSSLPFPSSFSLLRPLSLLPSLLHGLFGPCAQGFTSLSVATKSPSTFENVARHSQERAFTYSRSSIRRPTMAYLRQGLLGRLRLFPNRFQV